MRKLNTEKDEYLELEFKKKYSYENTLRRRKKICT